ncbi:DUF5675 family protein [Chondrinema litorale]|uniref:DUF5675 family protein n=1 Tax=Chondrinema litorale TaxID=2994555 RepID=UPI002543023C|nr:DUF5675 family protein [Chondrinema litorale]UZR96068.1 DUF5675 family protein [Chondrinema litorale]
MHAILQRKEYTDKQVLGEFKLFDESAQEIFSAASLELPWRNNESRVSCIPTGKYKAVRRVSDKYAKSYHIQELDRDQVNGRSWILIHKGNYHTDILGCILLGEGHIDINGDGYKDVYSSGKVISKLVEIAGEAGFTLEIKGEQPDYTTLSKEIKRNNEPIVEGNFAEVTASSLNIRSSSNINADKVAEPLKHGEIVEVLDVDGGWAKVKVRDLIGFVSFQYLRKADKEKTKV